MTAMLLCGKKYWVSRNDDKTLSIIPAKDERYWDAALMAHGKVPDSLIEESVARFSRAIDLHSPGRALPRGTYLVFTRGVRISRIPSELWFFHQPSGKKLDHPLVGRGSLSFGITEALKQLDLISHAFNQLPPSLVNNVSALSDLDYYKRYIMIEERDH